MPSLDINLVNTVLKNDVEENDAAPKKYPCFVETGTLYGHTILAMEPYFDTLYTVEISEMIYGKLDNVHKTHSKINFLLGDSSIVMEDICKRLDNNTVFFLDGHWSSCETGKGAKDCPLYEEITHINKYFKHNGIIIIDDFRLFGKGPNKKNCLENWEDINKKTILELLAGRITNVYHLPSDCAPNDRLVIHINAQN